MHIFIRFSVQSYLFILSLFSLSWKVIFPWIFIYLACWKPEFKVVQLTGFHFLPAILYVLSICKSYSRCAGASKLLLTLECAVRFDWACLKKYTQGAVYIMNMVHCEFLCLSAMVTCKDVFLLFSIFPSIINGCTTLNGNQEGGTGEIYNTGCYTVNENAPSIVLVLRCWVTGNKWRAGADNLLNFPLLTEPSTTHAVLKEFPLFLFVLFFLWFYFSTGWFPSSFLYLEPPSDSLKLRIEMVERNVCVFQLHDSIQTIHFYLSMNVILKDNDPIHIFNCLNIWKCLCVSWYFSSFHTVECWSSYCTLNLYNTAKHSEYKAYESGGRQTTIYIETGSVLLVPPSSPSVGQVVGTKWS